MKFRYTRVIKMRVNILFLIITKVTDGRNYISRVIFHFSKDSHESNINKDYLFFQVIMYKTKEQISMC